MQNDGMVAGQPVSTRLTVVLFSGGRGSGGLSTWLARQPEVDLTIAINGYDDGASTGEVRRFLGDALGPSDFRKNASRLAGELRSCPEALIEVLDSRLPADCDEARAREILQRAPSRLDHVSGEFVRAALERFVAELGRATRRFDFRDCSLGNLVFAGVFLQSGRRFNVALDMYCAALDLVNRGGVVRDEMPYVEPGPLALLEDLRPLVLEDLEEGTTGRHDASKVRSPLCRRCSPGIVRLVLRSSFTKSDRTPSWHAACWRSRGAAC